MTLRLQVWHSIWRYEIALVGVSVVGNLDLLLVHFSIYFSITPAGAALFTQGPAGLESSQDLTKISGQLHLQVYNRANHWCGGVDYMSRMRGGVMPFF